MSNSARVGGELPDRPADAGVAHGRLGLTRRGAAGRLGAGTAGALLAACGGPGQRGEQRPAAERAPVRLSLSMYDDLAQQAQRWTLWSEGFQAGNPHVTVDVMQIAPAAVYLEKIGTMFAAATPPDVLIVHGNWGHAWSALGYFLELGPIIARERYDLSDFWGPLHHKVYVYRGKRYGMTNMTGSGTPAINVTHFRNRGAPPPPPTGRTGAGTGTPTWMPSSAWPPPTAAAGCGARRRGSPGRPSGATAAR